MTQLWVSFAALAPMLAGPLPAADQAIVAQLCNGGTFTIPIEKSAPELPEDCHQKGCHARCSRSSKKNDADWLD